MCHWLHKAIQTSYLWVNKLFRWLVTNLSNPSRIKQVEIHESGSDDFIEFPESLRTIGFYPSDRKFVATAVANDKTAPIVQASDSKWIGWEPVLNAEGIEVHFLCRNELETIFNHKIANR